MVAAVYNRVSTEKQQQEGLSLQTQKEACIKYAKEHGYEVPDKYILDEVYSGLTLNRPNLNRLLEWVKSGDVQAVVIYSTDRFSRDGYDLLTLIRDCEVNNAKLLCVNEDLGEGKVGELLNFVRGWASSLEATRIKERASRNKRAKAERGSIPQGYGKYGGYTGLDYDVDTGAFKHDPGQIHIAQEILERYANGDTASHICTDLQKRNVLTARGKPFGISSINRILAHARVYAGIIIWKGIEIKGKVDPIITERLASIIDKRRKLNKEHSFGFGHRKWFSGRVFCGICGRRYAIYKGKSCRCNGDDIRNPQPCNAPRLPYARLERLLAKSLLFAYSDEEAVVARVAEAYQDYEQQKSELEGRIKEHEANLDKLAERTRRLSYQHELGVLNKEEFANRVNAVKARQEEILDIIRDIQSFTVDKPIPPDPEKVRASFNWLKRLKEEEALLILLSKSPNRHKLGDKLADTLDFRATIIPNKDGWKLEVRVNLPLEPGEVYEKDSKAVVTTSIWSNGNDCCVQLLFSINPKTNVVETLLVGANK